MRTDRQGQGIGKQMVEYLYKMYGLGSEMVIVQTRAMSEGFYENMGWVTVDCTEIDLSVWSGKGRGYGVHRSPQMVKYPIFLGQG